MAVQVIEPNLRLDDAWEPVRRLREAGCRAADLHVHSSCSYDVLPIPQLAPEALYHQARARGMDYVTITDHDTMDAYDRIGWQRESLVTGVEISIRDLKRVGHTLHVNVYDLNRQEFYELEQIAKQEQNIESFVAYLRRENLPCVYNHPFWAEPQESLSYTAVEAVAQELPVLELNAKRIRELNLVTLALCTRHGKGAVAAGDSHIGDVGKAYTLAQGDTFREWFGNVAQGRATLLSRHLDMASLTAEIATWRELLFEGNAPLAASAEFTGNRAIDAMMRFFTNRAQDRRLLLVMPAFRGIVRELTDSGLPSALYLYSQQQSAHRITASA